MKEKELNDPVIQQAFNDGYLIKKYEPELAEKLLNIKAVTPYVVALQEGCKQYSLEQAKDKLPTWLTGNHPAKEKTDAVKTKNKGLDR